MEGGLGPREQSRLGSRALWVALILPRGLASTFRENLSCPRQFHIHNRVNDLDRRSHRIIGSKMKGCTAARSEEDPTFCAVIEEVATSPAQVVCCKVVSRPTYAARCDPIA